MYYPIIISRFDFTYVFLSGIAFSYPIFIFFAVVYCFLQFSPYAQILDFTVLSNTVTSFTKEQTYSHNTKAVLLISNLR